MTEPDRELRARVAAQLVALGAGPLASTGERASIQLPTLFGAGGSPTSERRRFHSEVIVRYLDQQPDVLREGKAALLTAGPPGAGKSTTVESAIDTTGWRRLDADIIKTFLIEEAVVAGRYADLLNHELADRHPVMPAELASLVHIESVNLLDLIRRRCISQGENVVIEGTLTWAQAGHEVLGDLIAHGYSEVTILDVEVPVEVAHDRAISRWWQGRQAHIHTGRGLGGRFTPPDAIDRAYPTRVTGTACARRTLAHCSTPTPAAMSPS